MKKIILTVFCILALPLLGQAANFNLSLVPDVALVSSSERINGVTIGIWSENPQSALALGVVNGSTGNSRGISLALIGNYSENYTGAHIGIVNWSSGSFKGVQFGTVNFTRKLTGVQFGFFNYAESIDNGVQIGLLNIIRTSPWFSDFPRAVAPFFPFINWRFE